MSSRRLLTGWAPALLATAAAGIVLAAGALSLVALLLQPSFQEWLLIEGARAFRCSW